MIPHVLSIAGSDPSGGAGIQADLKTFSALGVYGMTVITALTAQNTRGVSEVFELPHSFVGAQIEAIFRDIRVDAIKIGMPGSPATIQVIIDMIQRYKPRNIIFDPVIAAQSGDRLSSNETVDALRLLIPIADVITPNIPEAETLLGESFRGDMENFARELLEHGARGVLLKGGHIGGKNSNDLYMDGKTTRLFEEVRIKTNNNHGTGCTLSSAMAAYMAKGLPAPEAAEAAKKYVTQALKHADKLKVGDGNGPVHHFFAHWR